MRTLAAAAMLLCVGWGAPALACIPESYGQLMATANVRQPDGTWRTIEISAFGAAADDARLAWILRLDAQDRRSPTGRLGAVVDAASGQAKVFPVGAPRRAADRVTWLTSMQSAASEFGIRSDRLFFDTHREVFTERPAPVADRRTFLNRPCSFHRFSDGSWNCIDRTGVPLAFGPRAGALSFQVTHIDERRPNRAGFAAPAGFVETDRRTDFLQGLMC
jgi:hypothetical protein